MRYSFTFKTTTTTTCHPGFLDKKRKKEKKRIGFSIGFWIIALMILAPWSHDFNYNYNNQQECGYKYNKGVKVTIEQMGLSVQCDDV